MLRFLNIVVLFGIIYLLHQHSLVDAFFSCHLIISGFPPPLYNYLAGSFIITPPPPPLLSLPCVRVLRGYMRFLSILKGVRHSRRDGVCAHERRSESADEVGRERAQKGSKEKQKTSTEEATEEAEAVAERAWCHRQTILKIGFPSSQWRSCTG